jgi:hypothetical protein
VRIVAPALSLDDLDRIVKDQHGLQLDVSPPEEGVLVLVPDKRRRRDVEDVIEFLEGEAAKTICGQRDPRGTLPICLRLCLSDSVENYDKRQNVEASLKERYMSVESHRKFRRNGLHRSRRHRSVPLPAASEGT